MFDVSFFDGNRVYDVSVDSLAQALKLCQWEQVRFGWLAMFGSNRVVFCSINGKIDLDNDKAIFKQCWNVLHTEDDD